MSKHQGAKESMPLPDDEVMTAGDWLQLPRLVGRQFIQG